MYKQRLELDWVDKDVKASLEPRILVKDSEHSFGSRENVLIHGDNLLALKALESDYAGTVKCVFIDPPYNTGSAFTHYEDGIEHSLWLSLMRDRLEILRKLLRSDGSIWVTIDDNECHYLKIVLDEIFGRQNFVSNVVWQKKYAPANDALWFSTDHDHILVYAKSKDIWRPNRLERSSDQDARYKNPDNDSRGPWKPENYLCHKSAEERPNLYYPIVNPNTGEEIWPKKTAVWRYNRERHQQNVIDNLVFWGLDGKNKKPAFKSLLSKVAGKGKPPTTIWSHSEVGHTQDAKREAQSFNPKDPFATPKPEKLLHKILTIATNEGDLVLDSFSGSGTTGAVAQKMNRKWIMIELGEHAFTHIVPRMKLVTEGRDNGGVTELCDWQGGSGFTTYSLAPSLLKKDSRGNWIISPSYDAAQLAQAVCKHEGFKFWPDSKTYWKQGNSSENDFIFVTTEFLTTERLDKIASQLKPDESLLICAKAFKVAKTKYPNITIKKIPQMLLGRCEFGRDDYSLNIKEPYQADLGLDEAEMSDE